MPDSPSHKNNSGRNSSLPQVLIVAFAGLAMAACEEAVVDTQADLAAGQLAMVEVDSTNAARMEESVRDDESSSSDEDECLVPGPFQRYFAGEKAFSFKSNPSPIYPYYDPSVCSTSPFTPHFSSGGRMTSMLYKLDNAKLGKFDMEEVGYGTLCFRVQDPTFSPFGAPMLAYGKIKVNGIEATINGQCTVTNDSLPVSGVKKMTCALPLVGPIPEGYIGGLLVTNSVLNLGAVQGISTGSILSLHLYKAPDDPVQVKNDSSTASLLANSNFDNIHPDATFW